jgi:hypothetical protein
LCGAGAGAPFSSAYLARLGEAARHLRWIMDDSGATPAIGDDDEGRVVALGPARDFLYPAAICAPAARWLGDAAAMPPPQQPTLLDAFVDKAPLASAAPSGRRSFASGGYSVWREPGPRGTRLLVFDHAPLGFLSIAAHGHADALAVWLHIGAEALLIDAGTYLYHTDTDARDRFRGAAAHNTLCLGGGDQSRIAGPFNWSRHAKTSWRVDGDWVIAAHDGYVESHGVRHVRRVRMSAGRIEIADALEGQLRAPADWTAGLTFHQDAAVTLRDDGAEAVLPSGARARVRAILEAEGAVELTTTEVSPGFGAVTPAARLIASGRVTAAGAIGVTTIELLD